jgi:tetratricopeptide (TPR) repeat protein
MENIQAKEYLTQGATLASQEKYEEALIFYDKAELENPMDTEVYLSKGIAYANLEKYDEAKGQFEKALKIDRKLGLAYFHLGSVAIMQNEIALGFENYNKAISNGYDDAQLYYSIALIHEENGEIDLAIRNYSKAIQRDALRPDIRIRKARLQVEANLIPEALQTLDETILTNPDVFEGYHLKFLIHMQEHQLDKAEEVINQGLELFPKDAGFILNKASLLIERGETDKAFGVLTALENDEETNDYTRRKIFIERAQIYATQDDAKSAISELEKANGLGFEEGVFDSEVVFLLANCHLAIEEFDKLLEYADPLFENSEDDYVKQTARYYKPLALKKLGRMDEAKPLYEDAINEYRNQSLAVPGHLDAYLLRAMCLRDLEKYDKALELIDYVIQLQPEQPEPRMLRVTILESLERNDEAQAETKEVNAMLPEELRRE